MNTVCLTGRLGGDPETRYTDSGSTVTSFRFAVNGFGRDAAAIWIDVECWEKTAEVVMNYARKGHKLAITGRLKADEWTDKTTGQKRSKLKVVASQVDLPPKSETEGDGGQGQGPRAAAQARSASPAWNTAPLGPVDDDSIPS
jgi:single-strand DNA-binding protein